MYLYERASSEPAGAGGAHGDRPPEDAVSPFFLGGKEDGEQSGGMRGKREGGREDYFTS